MHSDYSGDEEEDGGADLDCSHDDWMDEDESTAECTCLFCTERFSSAVATFIHCREKHEFDIVHMRERHQLDCFSYIQLVNYIRSSVSSSLIISAQVWVVH